MEEKIEVRYSKFDSWKEMSESDQELVFRAKKVMQEAYAPYSRFKVGATALLSNGEVVTGSNQENIAYPSGLCAERVALFYAGANFPKEEVKTLCIVAEGDLVDINTILSPCGACRQVMVETERRQEKAYRVILVSQNDVTLVFDAASHLLPLAFGL